MASTMLMTDPFAVPQDQSSYDADFDTFLKFDPASPESNKTLRQLSPPTTFAPTDFDDAFYSNDGFEDNLPLAGPSHNYNLHKQNTSLPTGSLSGLHNLNQPFPRQSFVSTMRESTDFNFNAFAGGSSSWNTGIPDNDIAYPISEGPSVFSSLGPRTSVGNVMNPNPIPHPTPNAAPGGSQPRASDHRPGRIYPGMHQEQAAQRQRQQLALQQQQRQRFIEQMMHRQQQSQSSHAQLAASPDGNLARDVIHGVISEKRHSTASSAGGDDAYADRANALSHFARMKKDEEDMDEDERLLASEEGKKLSSKERRQLRNKVSARAFRSRRKEYIGQLEGEVQAKSAECEDLRKRNQDLTSENQRLLDCMKFIIDQPGFAKAIPDMAAQQQESANVPAPQVVGRARSAQQPQNSSQMGLSGASGTEGGAFAGENEAWLNHGYPFSFNQPQVYSLFEVPQGPAVDHMDYNDLSGKFSGIASDAEDCVKSDLPALTAPLQNAKAECPAELPQLSDSDWNDPNLALYIGRQRESSAASPSCSTDSEESVDDMSSHGASTNSTQVAVVVCNDSRDRDLNKTLDRICYKLDAAMARISTLTSHVTPQS